MAHHEHNELGHVAPKKILFGTWGILMVLTFLTVAATHINLGSSGNLALALFIATVKATLVALFFMHLLYDKLFHTVGIVSGLLVALLFIGFALMDGAQYQDDVCAKRGANCERWNPDARPPR